MGAQSFEQKIQTSKLRGDAWLYCKSSKYLAGEWKLFAEELLKVLLLKAGNSTSSPAKHFLSFNKNHE